MTRREGLTPDEPGSVETSIRVEAEKLVGQYTPFRPSQARRWTESALLYALRNVDETDLADGDADDIDAHETVVDALTVSVRDREATEDINP